MLGDFIKSALSSVGITEKRVSEWLGEPCGCSERAEKLNLLDQWARQKARMTAEQAKTILAKFMGGHKDEPRKPSGGESGQNPPVTGGT